MLTLARMRTRILRLTTLIALYRKL
jgi:hypothetical protein